METNRISQIAIKGCLVLGLAICGLTAEANSKSTTGSKAKAKRAPAAIAKLPLSAQQRHWRLDHAQELMGRHYSRSVVRTGEDVKKINGTIYRWTQESLPKKFRRDSQRVAQAVIDESLRHSFDPVFVMSVILRESSFNPHSNGDFGEIGLMQIKPSTAAWIARKAGLKYKGPDCLKDPVTNIRLGTAYLAWLREQFDSHARLYLAAYNMGQRNVRRALSKNVWPRDYPGAVMENYVAYYRQLRESLQAQPQTLQGPS